jgi:hypothetical protein
MHSADLDGDLASIHQRFAHLEGHYQAWRGPCDYGRSWRPLRRALPRPPCQAHQRVVSTISARPRRGKPRRRQWRLRSVCCRPRHTACAWSARWPPRSCSFHVQPGPPILRRRPRLADLTVPRRRGRRHGRADPLAVPLRRIGLSARRHGVHEHPSGCADGALRSSTEQHVLGADRRPVRHGLRALIRRRPDA